MIDLIEARDVAHLHRRAGAEYGDPYESVVANQKRRPGTNGLEWLVGRGCFGVVCHSVAAVIGFQVQVSGVRRNVSGCSFNRQRHIMFRFFRFSCGSPQSVKGASFDLAHDARL